ncbi:MAG: HigA family addiction module antitoxin [Cyanobacteria bacterium J06638_22]
MIDTQKSDFRPDWVSPPGETIHDLLEERGWTQREFAKRIGYTPKHVGQLLSGKAPISDETAIRLERVLGSTASFWLTRDAQYQEAIARSADVANLAKEAGWLDEIPLKQMIKFGWVEKMSNPGEQMSACLKYFGVASVSSWRDQYERPLAAFKKSEKFSQSYGAVAAWLRSCELAGSMIETKPFDRAGFSEALHEARSLTKESDPSKFVPSLIDLCASVGVAVALCPAPSGCPATGATRWEKPDRALLMLSLRHKANDHLWFAFFHEAAHLLLHGKKLLFIEGTDVMSPDNEREADQFAADILIPPEAASTLPFLPKTRAAVSEFAKSIGIAPGIVVGRMQSEGLLRWNSALNKLKVRYRWNHD